MDRGVPRDTRELGEVAVDEEMASVVAAIELVAGGTASRVTLAGLRLGGALMPEAQRRAERRHVRVRPLWPMGDGPVDLIVEPIERDD